MTILTVTLKTLNCWVPVAEDSQSGSLLENNHSRDKYYLLTKSAGIMNSGWPVLPQPSFPWILRKMVLVFITDSYPYSMNWVGGRKND